VKRNTFTIEGNDLFSTIGSFEVLCYSQRCKVEYTSQGEDKLVQDSNNVEEKNVKSNNVYVRVRNHPRLRFKIHLIQSAFGLKKKRIAK